MNDLEKLLEGVNDEDTFLKFLKALALDRADEVSKEAKMPSNPYGPGANGWQHGSIEAFLEAAAAWAEDSKNALRQIDGPPKVAAPTNPWKQCAEILYMGKHYE